MRTIGILFNIVKMKENKVMRKEKENDT